MIRLIVIVLLFLVSLLATFKAPAYYLWLLAIGVSEFPLLFAGITSVFLIAGIWLQKYQLASTVIGVIALLFFLSPIVRAYIVAASLKKDFITAFGPGSASIHGDSTQAPFSFFKLFEAKPVVKYQSFVYNTDKAAPLSLNFYPAALGGKRPCIVSVHGGSWAGGDNSELPELNSYLAQQGYNVAAINYRLAPKYQTPAPVIDVAEAFAYLKAHAIELHIDTNNFVLLGRSAGAQIALLYAYTHPEPGLRGVVDFYGPADMVWGYSVPANPLIMDSRKVMENYIGGSYHMVPQKYAACSPLEFVNKSTIPTLLLHGDNDVLVAPEHSRRLYAKLAKNNIPHFWLKLPWATHGFDYNLYGPGGQLSTYVVERFINTITK
ncbi:alpha/beta hydrolase [Mucilaginibacter psychrotolerans]|uniref:Alpha/beta hydrolase n=1 Tax=Mucilaginibacter psychrotolerans TaxID=1524096 RepID=A0A4Y8SC39_9SPHI|nr:alpha/beta hydrolase [Mucilaginibacter psychrotolerans]TFF36538.1 alpha/beta hydrolase [Mucilaginibacter psychrotolerans]